MDRKLPSAQLPKSKSARTASERAKIRRVAVRRGLAGLANEEALRRAGLDYRKGKAMFRVCGYGRRAGALTRLSVVVFNIANDVC
jgi:hypothetical protein